MSKRLGRPKSQNPKPIRLSSFRLSEGKQKQIKVKCLSYDEKAEKLSMTYINPKNITTKTVGITVKYSLENIIETILLALEYENNREIINSSKSGFKVNFYYSYRYGEKTVSFKYEETTTNLTWQGGYLSKWDKLKIIKTCIRLLPELNNFKHLLKAKSYTELKKLL